MDIHQAKELLQKYQADNCTPSEIKLLENWYNQLIDTGEWQWGEGEKDIMEKALEARIMKQVNSKQKKLVYLIPRFQWWAAASFILFLAGFSYFFFYYKIIKPTQVLTVLRNDIKAPQSNKAMITLSGGQQVYLDSAGNGALAIQGNVKLVKLANGNIAYQHNSGEVSTKMEYNTLSNPRGSKVINMDLTDGSKVWLNAGSSLTYPVVFMGSERKISVTGEAYFEVAHDASRSFIVTNGNMNVAVLGTHFNVNAYEDDGDDVKVTLLKGSVKVNNENTTGLLKPGQQAVVTKEIKVVNDVNLDLVMAWKNGYFQFDNASLQIVLKEVSRWYDVNVVYEGKNHPRQFLGEIQRDLNLSEMLKILERNKVHFNLQGKELRVMPD